MAPVCHKTLPLAFTHTAMPTGGRPRDRRRRTALAAALLLGGCSLWEDEPGEPAWDPGRGLSSNWLSGASVYFAEDSSELSPEARATVATWAQYLRGHPERSIAIEGHTDEHGTRAFKTAIGARHAAAVRDYLVILGVAPEQIRMVSYGRERPAVAGSHQAAQRQNRRAVAITELQ
jgi:peptidoglycan-associated lipoprotein